MARGDNLQLDILAEYFGARGGRRNVLVVEETISTPFRRDGLLICQRQGRLMVCTPDIEIPFGPLNGTQTLTFTALNLGAAISAIGKAGLRRGGQVSITSIKNLKGALEVTLDIADAIFEQVLEVLRGIPGVTLPSACEVNTISPSVIQAGGKGVRGRFRITGTGLASITGARAEGPVNIPAIAVVPIDDNTALVIVDFAPPVLGIYDLVAVTVDGECRLENAITLTAPDPD